MRSALKFVERLGHGWLWFGGPLLVLALSEDAAQRGAATTLLGAMLLDLATVALLKALVRRPRPPYNLPDMLVVSVDRYSFPSGHASRTTVLAGLALGCAATLVRRSCVPLRAALTRAPGRGGSRRLADVRLGCAHERFARRHGPALRWRRACWRGAGHARAACSARCCASHVHSMAICVNSHYIPHAPARMPLPSVHPALFQVSKVKPRDARRARSSCIAFQRGSAMCGGGAPCSCFYARHVTKGPSRHCTSPVQPRTRTAFPLHRRGVKGHRLVGALAVFSCACRAPHSPLY
jgi:hypothetical protein